MKLSHYFLAFMLVLPMFAQADELRPTSPAPSEKAVTPQMLSVTATQVKSFDTGLMELPVHYVGTNFMSLFDAVSKNFADKDEFETTVTYQQRIDNALTQPLLEQLNGNDSFAIGVKWLEKGIKYDADTQTLKLRELLEGSKSSELLGDEGFDLGGAKVEILETYMGKTAQGGERQVSKVRKDFQHLSFKNLKDFSFQSDFPGYAGVIPPLDFGFDLQLDSARAKEAKSNLYKLIIFKLAKPYALTESRSFAATFDSPQEGTIYQHSLYTIVRAKRGEGVVKESFSR